MVELPSKFSIRVYGIWFRAGKILLSEEQIGDIQMRKFPGGGVEFGEGLAEALRREFHEELGLELGTVRHIHTLDAFVQSRFRPDEQVITVHYEVEGLGEPDRMEVTQKTRWGNTNNLRFFWEEAHPDLIKQLSFEADRVALREWFNTKDGRFR